MDPIGLISSEPRLDEPIAVHASSPSDSFASSKHMKEFLARLKGINLRDKAGFAFDTKLDSHFSGSASRFIEKKLEELGLHIIRARASAIVMSQKKSEKVGKAVLKDGMEELFEKIGNELGTLLESRYRALQGITRST